MLKSLNTAATGMAAQQTNMDVIANNIANVSTNGFKRSRAEFEDLMYQTMKEPGIISYNYYLSPDEEKILIVEQYKSLSAFQDHGKTLFAGPLGDRFKSHFTVNSIVMAGGNLPDSVQNFTIRKTIGGFGLKCM